MGFKESDEAMGAGLFFGLSQDKESATIIFLQEPIPRDSEFRGQARTQYCFPIFGPEGPQVWTTGAGTYIDIRDNWEAYRKGAVRVTRHGKANDKRTRYAIDAVARPKRLAAALAEADAEELAGLLVRVASFDADDDIPI